MAIFRIYRRNSTFVDLAQLIEEISRLGLVDALQNYHNKPLETRLFLLLICYSFGTPPCAIRSFSVIFSEICHLFMDLV